MNFFITLNPVTSSWTTDKAQRREDYLVRFFDDVVKHFYLSETKMRNKIVRDL